VLAEGPVPQFSLLTTATQPIDVSRASSTFPAAWRTTCIGSARRAERVECSVRLSAAA